VCEHTAAGRGSRGPRSAAEPCGRKHDVVSSVISNRGRGLRT
jgi:hypothetical protein